MDMAFIRNIERNERDFRLVELIIDIVRYLKVPVVAEGVETENQLKLLRDAGCDLMQGYYFSPPLNAVDFEQKILRCAGQVIPERSGGELSRRDGAAPLRGSPCAFPVASGISRLPSRRSPRCSPPGSH